MANMKPNLDPVTGKFVKRTELTPLQLKAICMLVEGTSKTDMCKDLGIPRATLYNWLDTDLFMNEYRKACDKVYRMNLGKAMNKLSKMMDIKDNRTALKAVEDMLKLNDYLNTKVDISEKTTMEFVIGADNEE